MSDSIYSFENKGRRKFSDEQSEDVAMDEFAKRLGFEGGNYKEKREHRDILLDFILNYHKVISRYQELQAREAKLRKKFTVVSLALLFIIPLLILAMGVVFPGDKGSITAQVTAVLTGLLAVHKSLSSWMDKRKVIGNFWKAESDLKTRLYSFEDKWKGKAMEDVTGGGRRLKVSGMTS